MDYKETFTGLVFSILLIFTNSCSSGVKKATDSPPEKTLVSGKIDEKVTCSENPEFTYSLYLPSKAIPGTSQTWPVIIAFDPHGSGLTPVRKYRELAEKCGYILAGSNNSKNGQTASETENIVHSLILDFLSRYPIDTNRIYVAGFSGGSRVASLAALTHKEIKGVIGCGAGFPGWNQLPAQKFDYFGCVGLADFNLNEMVRLDTSLQKMHFRHCLVTFDGPHEWPPMEIMEKGFLWLSFNAMKDGRIKKDDLLIGSIKTKMAKLATNQMEEKNRLESAGFLEYGLNCLEGLANVTSIEKVLVELKQNPGYRRQLKHRKNLLIKEQMEQKMMTDQLFVKDKKWWKNQIGKYKSTGNSSDDVEENMKNKRLLSFLRLVCYSNARAALNQNNIALSFRIIDIYELSDPMNPEPDYLRSILFMREQDTVSSMAQLQKALDKGFSDKVRIIQQNEFQGLKDYRPYFDLLQKIK